MISAGSVHAAEPPAAVEERVAAKMVYYLKKRVRASFVGCTRAPSLLQSSGCGQGLGVACNLQALAWAPVAAGASARQID